MKVAIVHDQLAEFGGAERVLVAIKEMFPEAEVFTSTLDINGLGSHKKIVANWNIKTSWFGKIPLINKLYSPLRFLTPLIWESFDFSGYDLVISSTGSWMSKGVITKKPAIHISYIHHPPRYLYGYETAIEWQKHLLIKIYGNIINLFLRNWDFKASQRPDFLIANSEETRRRIQKFYRRDSTVIYPPVTIPKDLPPKTHRLKTYYLTVSRLARAKHVDVLIRAANEMKFKLKVVGTGRDVDYLKSIAGPTVEFLDNVPDEKMSELYKNAKAFLFASVDEEFGIAPVEAMGYGLPVIAYKSGGIPETVRDEVNGFLFDSLNSSDLIQKLKQFETLTDKKYLEMRKNARDIAEKYSQEIFKKKLKKFIHTVLLQQAQDWRLSEQAKLQK